MTGTYTFQLQSYYLSLNEALLLFTGRAIIVTHPNDAIINASQRVVLICQGSGKGTLSYEWQVYNFDESNWENLTVNATNILVWRLRASEKYRCIVYNEAGGSISNISTVFLMGMLLSFIYASV